MKNHHHPAAESSRWPHRIAVLLVCAVFPLIWVGGLVTTYDAGMAVPDWPSTYGYNMFLYPWQTWLAGPFDLFIEHGHRLLGALAGMLTIALVVAVFAADGRQWVRGLAVLALVMVIIQGVLGGARVVMDERALALIHGCFGPAYFVLTVMLAAVTSSWWHRGPQSHQGPQSGPAATAGWKPISSIATICLGLAYVQLILGANLRHVSPFASPAFFRLVVWLHLFFAAVLAVYILWLAYAAVFSARRVDYLRWPVTALVGLLVVQGTLGGATWVAKYAWPAWMADWTWAARYTVQADSWLQAVIVTGHMATGSLILAFCMSVVARSMRLQSVSPAGVGSQLAVAAQNKLDDDHSSARPWARLAAAGSASMTGARV